MIDFHHRDAADNERRPVIEQDAWHRMKYDHPDALFCFLVPDTMGAPPGGAVVMYEQDAIDATLMLGNLIRACPADFYLDVIYPAVLIFSPDVLDAVRAVFHCRQHDYCIVNLISFHGDSA